MELTKIELFLFLILASLNIWFLIIWRELCREKELLIFLFDKRTEIDRELRNEARQEKEYGHLLSKGREYIKKNNRYSVHADDRRIQKELNTDSNGLRWVFKKLEEEKFLEKQYDVDFPEAASWKVV